MSTSVDPPKPLRRISQMQQEFALGAARVFPEPLTRLPAKSHSFDAQTGPVRKAGEPHRNDPSIKKLRDQFFNMSRELAGQNFMEIFWEFLRTFTNFLVARGSRATDLVNAAVKCGDSAQKACKCVMWWRFRERSTGPRRRLVFRRPRHKATEAAARVGSNWSSLAPSEWRPAPAAAGLERCVGAAVAGALFAGARANARRVLGWRAT